VTETPASLDIRHSLGQLSRGLIAYGIIGLVVAAIGVGALVWVNGRVGSVRAEVETSVDQLSTTIERTAKALEDASTTAQGFTVTVDQSAVALTSAAATMTQVRTDLLGLESQLRAVNILGTSPLASAADAVGRTATSLDGLDTKLAGIADGLGSNRAALANNATSLGQLGSSTAAMATRLGSGSIEGSLGDVQSILAVTLALFAAWSLVPAVGALVLGVWLRRELERSSVAAARSVL
jgi:hypothetical protein